MKNVNRNTDEAGEGQASETALSQGADSALEEGLRLLEHSQGLIRTIFLGLAMQYRSLDLQRCLLLAQAEDPEAELSGPEPRAIQTAASLITLCALFGFYRQAEELACEAARAGECPDRTEATLSAVIILISLIRLVRLNRPEPLESEPESTEEREIGELEELGEGAELLS